MRIITISNITILFFIIGLFFINCPSPLPQARSTVDFGRDWRFSLGDIPAACEPGFDDSGWRRLRLPHDWSIEGDFSRDHPATPGGGALPGGIGWYRKSFVLPEADSARLICIDFDGVYQNSEVWINGHYLGKRPYGYSSFRYELTPYLNYGDLTNVIAVRVDNSRQPNSRWYTGSGIYRNVWLVTTSKIHVAHWGTFVTTPEVSETSATINIKTKIGNKTGEERQVDLRTIVYDDAGKRVTAVSSTQINLKGQTTEIEQTLRVSNPALWSVENPRMYTAVAQLRSAGRLVDRYETPFGIRAFAFDAEDGFILNGQAVKIKGVCNHHDLGCLGAAVNTRALERQLELLKEMGCNGIRTAHNPPALELLELCDRMGFIVMDEAFDMWKKKKTAYDYHLHFDEWHRRDLEDMIRRDRNHPSIFMWSIGNEVLEQWDKQDSGGAVIARELSAIIKNLDPTRPVTAACNATDPQNPLIRSGALDLIGYNYAQDKYADIPKNYPDRPFIATETVSALATRGEYDMPSDSIRRWPSRWDKPFLKGNPDHTCSSYDNCSAPWGSTHAETWRVVKAHDFISGMYVWTGFDYLGEPTPYWWPARSSYFGIYDLAGFPKDAFYFYKSEWSNEPVLHLFPHWNWLKGTIIDVWAYTNYDEVELFLNGKSLGKKQKSAGDFKLVWHLPYSPGTLKAVAKKAGCEPLVREIKTAGKAARIIMQADRHRIRADSRDLSFVSVKVVDEAGILVPRADNLIEFDIEGEGVIIGVDNGLQTSHESFQANYRKAFNGCCLAVIRSIEKAGRIILTASSDGLTGATIMINTQ